MSNKKMFSKFDELEDIVRENTILIKKNRALVSINHVIFYQFQEKDEYIWVHKDEMVWLISFYNTVNSDIALKL